MTTPEQQQVEPIELVDTFADGSLEMTEAGDKFRVAVIQFPITLRTASIDNTVFEEIAVLRLNATPFGPDFELIAELEVSAAGQSVELQLYNLTTPGTIATLSSSSLVTEKKVAAFTLPQSEVLYSVRLRRVGGASGQRVSCRSVMLKRSYHVAIKRS